MKSRLLSAELTHHGFAEDVFELEAAIGEDSTVRLALTQVHKAEGPEGPPVVLLHGQFSNRLSWYRRDPLDVASLLAAAGYSVWIPEMRGHGLSPANVAFLENRVRDYAEFDLPAIQSFVYQRSAQPAVWAACGLGAWALFGGLKSGWLQSRPLSALVLLGLEDTGLPGRSGGLSFWTRMALRRRGLVPVPEGAGVEAEAEPLSILEFDPKCLFEDRSMVPDSFAGVPLTCLDWQGASFNNSRQLSKRVLNTWPGAVRHTNVACDSSRPLRENSVSRSLFALLRQALLAQDSVDQAQSDSVCEPH